MTGTDALQTHLNTYRYFVPRNGFINVSGNPSEKGSHLHRGVISRRPTKQPSMMLDNTNRGMDSARRHAYDWTAITTKGMAI